MHTLRALAILLLTASAILIPENSLRVDAAQRSEDSRESIAAQSAEVLVDVVVTDRKNRPVAGLEAQDFRVFEEDAPQQIVSFKALQGADSRESSGAPAPNAATSTDVPAPRDRLPNLVVLLLDYSTTQFENQRLVRDAAVKYVQKRLQPNDYMAVFALNAGLRSLSGFTNDKAQLTAALETGSPVASALAAERAELSKGIVAGEVAAGASENVSTPAGLTDTEAVIARQSGDSFAALAMRMLAARITAQYTVLRSAIDQRQTRGVLTAVRAIARGVDSIQGRKSLVLFSEGFRVSPNLEGEPARRRRSWSKTDNSVQFPRESRHGRRGAGRARGLKEIRSLLCYTPPTCFPRGGRSNVPIFPSPDRSVLGPGVVEHDRGGGVESLTEPVPTSEYRAARHADICRCSVPVCHCNSRDGPGKSPRQLIFPAGASLRRSGL